MDTQELNEANMSAAEARANDWAKRHGISATFAFVPFSQSRNAQEKHPSLNWKVTLYKSDIRGTTGHDQPESQDFAVSKRPILGQFDYMQGSGHAPSYKQNMRLDLEREAVKRECETGRKSTVLMGCNVASGKPIAPPKLADVLYSIASDSEALDYSSFEDWASSFGYETDSKKAEAIYRTCLEYALKLLGALGDKGLQELRNAVSDM